MTAREENHPRHAVDAAPPLSDEAIQRIRELLPPPSPAQVERYLAEQGRLTDEARAILDRYRAERGDVGGGAT